jgi:hypothetical protein
MYEILDRKKMAAMLTFHGRQRKDWPSSWRTLQFNGQQERDGRMTIVSKATGMTLVAAAITSLLTAPVHSQGFGKKGGRSGAATEQHPKIDEKAYKAALDRIPTPRQGYDPWSQMRPSEPAKIPNKSN